jgi:methylglyoxal synthase
MRRCNQKEKTPMPLTIALIAHDRTKPALADWARRHADILVRHRMIATATTGNMIRESCPELELTTVKSGPLAGDQQIGALDRRGRHRRAGVLSRSADPHAA